MASSEKKYSDESLSDSQNVLKILFSEDTLSKISNYCTSLLVDPEFKPSPIETDQEKFLYTTTCGKAYVDNSFYDDPIKFATEVVNKIDFKSIKMKFNILSNNNADDKDDDDDDDDEDSALTSHLLNSLLKNEPYLKGFFNMYNINIEKQQKISNLLTQEKPDKEILAYFFENEEVFKGLLTFVMAAGLEEKIKKSHKEIDKDFFNKCLKVSKYCVSSYPNEYQLWEASVVDKIQQVVYLNAPLIQDKTNIYLNITNAFMSYYTVYTEEGKYIIFENDLKTICKTPARTAKFIEFLKEFEYGTDFCLGYQKYIEKTNATPLFNPYIFNPIPLELVKDDDKKHKNWFIPIQSNKFLKNSLKDRYDTLIKLHTELKANNLIDVNTPVGLFVYRFSGLQTPVGPEISMQWSGSKTMLAILINLLYNDKISEIPYSRIASFFGYDSQKSNLSSHYKPENPTIKKHIIFIKEILFKCGFNENKL